MWLVHLNMSVCRFVSSNVTQSATQIEPQRLHFLIYGFPWQHFDEFWFISYLRAKYQVSSHDGCAAIMWVTNFVTELGFIIKKKILICENKQSIIPLSLYCLLRRRQLSPAYFWLLPVPLIWSKRSWKFQRGEGNFNNPVISFLYF